MKTVHYVVLACPGLAAGLLSLIASLPPGAGPYLKAGAAVVALVGGVLGVVSDSATKKDVAS